MKDIKFSALLVIIMMSFVVSGMVMAEEESGMSNRQYCELEAEEAGMMDEADIEDYVAQCLEEIRNQSESEVHEDDNDDDTSEME